LIETVIRTRIHKKVCYINVCAYRTVFESVSFIAFRDNLNVSALFRLLSPERGHVVLISIITDPQTIKLNDMKQSIIVHFHKYIGPGWRSQYSDLLRVGRSGDRILVGARFSEKFQNYPGAHPASYAVGTGSFPEVTRPGRGVDHQPPSSVEVKERVELYHYSPWSFVASSRVNFTLLLYIYICVCVCVCARARVCL
jgi:hypothetical protein